MVGIELITEGLYLAGRLVPDLVHRSILATRVMERLVAAYPGCPTGAGTESSALPVRIRYAGQRFEEALPRVGGPEQRGPGCLYPEPHPTVHGTG